MTYQHFVRWCFQSARLVGTFFCPLDSCGLQPLRAVRSFHTEWITWISFTWFPYHRLDGILVHSKLCFCLGSIQVKLSQKSKVQVPTWIKVWPWTLPKFSQGLDLGSWFGAYKDRLKAGSWDGNMTKPQISIWGYLYDASGCTGLAAALLFDPAPWATVWKIVMQPL